MLSLRVLGVWAAALAWCTACGSSVDPIENARTSLLESSCPGGGIAFESDPDREGPIYVVCVLDDGALCFPSGDGAPPGRITWWDARGKLVRQADCQP